MKYKHPVCLFLLTVLVSFVFLSCSVRQDLTLDFSGEGTGRIEVTLQPVLTEYLTDLAMVMSNHPDPGSLPLFDEAGIWSSFARSPQVELLSVSIPTRETLILEFRFTDINSPFEDLPGAERNLISYQTRGDLGILDFYLAGENFFQAAAYFPLMDENMAAYFGPDPQNPVSEDLYKEDLEMALEDYLGGTSIDRVLEDSRVRLRVRVDGEVTKVTGGKREAEGALFETPLIRFLTLKNPIEYHLEFRRNGSSER